MTTRAPIWFQNWLPSVQLGLDTRDYTYVVQELLWSTPRMDALISGNKVCGDPVLESICKSWLAIASRVARFDVLTKSTPLTRLYSRVTGLVKEA